MVIVLSQPASAAEVTDLAGRTVTVPDQVERIGAKVARRAGETRHAPDHVISPPVNNARRSLPDTGCGGWL